MDRENLKKVGGAVLVVAGVGFGFWFSLILADVITFVWAFLSIGNVLEGRGVNEYIAKLVAVAFAGSICWFANRILYYAIKRDKRWVPIVAAIMVAWFVVMYIVSSPYSGSPINPFNGKAQQCYRDQYGVIHLIGRGAEAGPYGEAVKPCSAEDAQEYQRQSGGSGISFLGKWLFGDQPEAMALRADVEQVEILPDKTVVHFAVTRINNFRAGRFYRPNGWNYLADESGQTYDLTKDNGEYPNWVDAQTHKDFDNSDKPHADTKIVRPDEVYRFTAEYSPLRSGIHHLRLHDSRFGEANLDYVLSQGQIARAQADAAAVVQAQAQADAEAQQARADAETQRIQAIADAQAKAQAAEAEARNRAASAPQPMEQARIEQTQAQAPPAPVPCPPDPPPPQPGHLSLPSVAFRVISAGCVPAPTPQPTQHQEADRSRSSSVPQPSRRISFPMSAPFYPHVIDIGNGFTMEVINREIFPKKLYVAHVSEKDVSPDGITFVRWVGDYVVYGQGGVDRIR